MFRAKKIGNERGQPAHDECRKSAERCNPRRADSVRQAILVGQHRLNPTLTIRRSQLDDSLQVSAGKTLAFKNLSYLLAFTFRRQVDMALLDCFESLPIIMFGPGAEIVTGGH